MDTTIMIAAQEHNQEMKAGINIMRSGTFRIILLLLFIISLICGYHNVLAEQNRIWSFKFADLSISDALTEISHHSGIEIILDGEPSETSITKSYEHFTLDDVLMDMFSNQSFLALFNYNDQTLTSINIWLMPKADKMDRNLGTINTALNRQLNNRKTFNDQGQIQKIEHTPDLSRSVKEINRDSNNESVNNNNKSESSLPFRQSSSSINKSDGLEPDYQDRLSDHDENIDDDNPDNDSPPDQKQFGGLEPPPMPPGMIPVEE